MFKTNSPRNYRPNVDDVIVLITDGEPRGQPNSRQLTKQFAQDLKERKIVLLTAAVGPQSENAKFRELLQELATSPDYFFKAKFDYMETILEKLVWQSCTKPGKGTSYGLAAVYMKQGWPG